MKRLPSIFFVLACLLNIVGKTLGWYALAAAVKPALMPLLALSVVVYALDHRIDRRSLELLVCAELFGCAGDIFLLSDAFIFFAAGIVMFLVGHIFYLIQFGGRSWKGLGWKVWLPSLVVMGVLVAVLINLLGIEGALLPPMAVYGSALMLLIFSTLCGFVRFPDKRSWGILLCGACLFTFSDALIAAGTFGVADFDFLEGLIMLTYLSAQSLLAIGTLRIAKK